MASSPNPLSSNPPLWPTPFREPEKIKKELPPGFTRKGLPQSFLTKVATKVNWLIRCLKGAQGTCNFEREYLHLKAFPEYEAELTPDQRVQLTYISIAADKARLAMEKVIEEAEIYHKLPKKKELEKARLKARREGNLTLQDFPEI